MLLIFNPENTSFKGNSKTSAHGPINALASIHFALEIERNNYSNSKNMLIHNGIDIEKRWSGTTEVDQFYFGDPAGNHIELITEGKCGQLRIECK
jgi:hypothetical protein